MAWNEPGGNKQDPWGGGNRGNNQGPPDLDEALKKFQQKLGSIFGGSSGGGSGKGLGGSAIALVGVVVVLIYFVAGVKIVNEQERGVVLRFGVYDRTLDPGLNWAPPLIDKVYIENVTKLRIHTITRIPMLTQDLNIVEVDLAVQYSIGNAQDFVLNVRQPEDSLKEATDSALRHEVGSAEMHEVLTEGRGQLAIQVAERLQEYMDSYGSGIFIQTVNVEETSPPKEVQDAFDDVNRAREEEEQAKNTGQLHANDVIPKARGRAQRTIELANGYREETISRAQGEAERFENLLTEYKKSPRVMRERLYIDAVEQVMASSSKIMFDIEGGNNMLYLPLDKMMEARPAAQANSAPVSEEAIVQKIYERLRNEANANNRTRR